MSQKAKVSFDWEQEKYDEFRRTIAQLQAAGDLDTDTNRSEVIRAILENWVDDPDTDIVDS